MNAPLSTSAFGGLAGAKGSYGQSKGITSNSWTRQISLFLDWLPALAFIAFVLDAQLVDLLPSVMLKLPPPAVVIAAVWITTSIVTRDLKAQIPQRYIVLGGCLATWLTATTLVSVSLTSSAQWTLTVLVALLGMTLAGSVTNDRTKSILHQTLLICGLVLGILAVFEGLLKESFFYGPLTGDLSAAGSQHWSTFRSYVCFNHPLVAGTVLASLCVYSAFTFVDMKQKSRLNLAGLASLAAGAGSVFTVSRSAVLALGIAFILGCIALLRKRSRRRRLKIVWCVAAVAALYILFFSPVAGRSQSSEGASSAIFRTEVFNLIGPLSRPFEYLGSGPDTAQQWAYSSGYHQLLENSLVQLLVSIGVVGFLLLAASIIAIMASALKNHTVATFSALVALVCSSAAFGILETYPVIFIMFGVFGVLSTKSPEASASAPNA